MAILQTRELKKYYGAGDTLVKALDGVELSVENGEFVAIIGTSGSGKSTLLHMLGGLDRPTSGTVTVDGKELSAMRDEELTIFRRRKIGFVFQAYNLVPVLSVYENIVLPIQLDGGAVDESYVREVIAVLGLEKKLDAMVMRELYTKYKTAPTEEEKEKARKEYLDRRGVPESFRW